MDINKINFIFKLITKDIKCLGCKKSFSLSDLYLKRLSKSEGLIEAQCDKCKKSTYVNFLFNKIADNMAINFYRGQSPISLKDVNQIKTIMKNNKISLFNLYNEK